MIIPPIPQEYSSASQAIISDVLIKADDQNFKLDQDNFCATGSICLQSADGTWFQITISNAGVLGTSELLSTGDDARVDSEGRPIIASTNPYYTP